MAGNEMRHCISFLEEQSDGWYDRKGAHNFIDMENMQQIARIETMIHILKHRVGSPVLYYFLAQDLQCSDKIVKR